MAFPTTITASSLQIGHYQPTLISRSLNGNEQRAQIASHRWQLDANFSNLSESQRRDLQAFLYETSGALTAFDFLLPGDLGDTSSGYVGSLSTSASGSVGDTSITVNGTSSTEVLKKGDYFRFDGENKTYMVTADVTTDVSGNATVNFAPALQTAVSGSTNMTFNDVNMNVRFDGDTFSLNTDPTFYSTFNLKMIEVL